MVHGIQNRSPNRSVFKGNQNFAFLTTLNREVDYQDILSSFLLNLLFRLPLLHFILRSQVVMRIVYSVMLAINSLPLAGMHDGVESCSEHEDAAPEVLFIFAIDVLIAIEAR